VGIHRPRLHPEKHAEGRERRRHPPHLGAIREATGHSPRGWLGPGLTETWETPDLLAEEGYDYVCDWVLDDQPTLLKTRGKPIVNLPYTQECNDVAMMLIQHHKAGEYHDRACDQFDQLYADARHSARVMALVVPPLHHGRAAPPSNTSAAPSPMSGRTPASCSGPASRSSTGTAQTR